MKCLRTDSSGTFSAFLRPGARRLVGRRVAEVRAWSYRTSVPRYGYTLIEMIIAVSLTAVLMTAVWGLMSMYAALQKAGADVAAEQQLVRSVLQLIRDDLETVTLPVTENTTEYHDPSAVFDDVETDADTVTGGLDHDRSSFIFDINNLSNNQHNGPADVLIRGTSEVLRITVPCGGGLTASLDDAGLPANDAAETDGVTPSVNEFQTIIYQILPFGSTREGDLPFGLYRIQANAVRLLAMPDRRSPPDGDFLRDDLRLDRSNIEELLFLPANNSTERHHSLLRPSSCELIPEVVDCRFEYSGGEGWQPDWKSNEAGQLPRAVRITLDVVLLREFDEMHAVNLSQGSSGRLERRLHLSFVRNQIQTRSPLTANLQLTPRRYSELILLDSTMEAAGRIPGHSLAGGSWQ
ncbi:MAG: GspJ family type II secretion system protein [Fuerstiella sp.]|nr:GspJ family type II secretion system protein [Fuerstiella sp.]